MEILILLVSGDTDFRVFRDHGKIPGIDIAYMKPFKVAVRKEASSIMAEHVLGLMMMVMMMVMMMMVM